MCWNVFLMTLKCQQIQSNNTLILHCISKASITHKKVSQQLLNVQLHSVIRELRHVHIFKSNVTYITHHMHIQLYISNFWSYLWVEEVDCEYVLRRWFPVKHVLWYFLRRFILLISMTSCYDSVHITFFKHVGCVTFYFSTGTRTMFSTTEGWPTSQKKI